MSKSAAALKCAVARKPYSPAAEIAWIQGFGDCSRGLTMRVFLAPVVRCLERASKSNSRLFTTEIRRINEPLIEREFPLMGFTRAIPGTPCFVKSRSIIGIPIDKARVAPATEALTTIVTELNDQHSTIVLTGQSNVPEPIARIIDTAMCGRGNDVTNLAFFVADDGVNCIIVPCSEILRLCYASSPRRFVTYLKWGARSFEDDNAMFNGFCFVGRDEVERWYPARAERHRERAEYEIAQLLPRGIAHASVHGGFMPFIIRFPFTGQMSVSGYAVRQRGQGRDLTLFWRLVRVGPIVDNTPHGDDVRKRVQFWPLRSNANEFRLPGLSVGQTSDGVLYKMRRNLQLLQHAL